MSPAISAPSSSACRAARSSDRPSSSRAHHRPTGAPRITLLQPLLSLRARSPGSVICSSAERQLALGTRWTCISRIENNQPSRSNSPIPGFRPCVASQRAYALATIAATAPAPFCATPATCARSRPSAENNDSWVSSVIAPLRSNAVVNSVMPERPNVSRISASDMNSTGAPSASPIAPPSRQPRKMLLCAGDGSRRRLDGLFRWRPASRQYAPVRQAYRNRLRRCTGPRGQCPHVIRRSRWSFIVLRRRAPTAPPDAAACTPARTSRRAGP